MRLPCYRRQRPLTGVVLCLQVLLALGWSACHATELPTDEEQLRSFIRAQLAEAEDHFAADAYPEAFADFGKAKDAEVHGQGLFPGTDFRENAAFLFTSRWDRLVQEESDPLVVVLKTGADDRRREVLAELTSLVEDGTTDHPELQPDGALDGPVVQVLRSPLVAEGDREYLLSYLVDVLNDEIEWAGESTGATYDPDALEEAAE